MTAPAEPWLEPKAKCSVKEGHYWMRPPSPFYDAARRAGATRVCNRCHGWDRTRLCEGRSFGAYARCIHPARVERTGWDKNGRRGEYDWKTRTTAPLNETHWFCGVHDPLPRWEKARREAALRDARSKSRDHNDDVRASQERATSDLAAAAVEWRRWHFTDAPCAEPCEHMDCALARAVDAHNAAQARKQTNPEDWLE